MTQFYCKYTNVDKAGFSMCRSRLEVLLRGPTEMCVQKVFRAAQVIMIEVSDVKKVGSKGWRRDMRPSAARGRP